MRAAVLKGVGGPEQLVVEEVPEPEAADGPGDRRRPRGRDQLRGRPDPPRHVPADARAPAVLGSEIAGELDGARVIGLRASAGRRLRRARARSTAAGCFPLPESASFAEGAAFPMAFLTAWIPLTELVRIAFGCARARDRGRGAVGTAAVQVVKALNGAPGRRRRERGEARAPALARRRRGASPTSRSASSTRSTSCSTSSAATCSRRRSAC